MKKYESSQNLMPLTLKTKKMVQLFAHQKFWKILLLGIIYNFGSNCGTNFRMILETCHVYIMYFILDFFIHCAAYGTHLFFYAILNFKLNVKTFEVIHSYTFLIVS